MTETSKHIALVCPGGPITQELADQTGEIAAARFGDRIKLHFHPQCFLSAGHFAGTDAERSAAFLEVANDPNYGAIWFARGGYGACRIDENVFEKLGDAARAKTYLGYSDAGALLGRLYKECIGRPVHGPMPTDLTREGGEAAIARALEFLAGDKNNFEASVNSDAPAAAFNVTVLAHLVATNWVPDLKDHIVMLEDVGEYLYRIDRAMFAIMSSKALHAAAGIKLGRISDIPENDRPFGQTEEEVVKHWCAQANIPYLGRADIGHDAQNKIVPFRRRLKTSKNSTVDYP